MASANAERVWLSVSVADAVPRKGYSAKTLWHPGDIRIFCRMCNAPGAHVYPVTRQEKRQIFANAVLAVCFSRYLRCDDSGVSPNQHGAADSILPM